LPVIVDPIPKDIREELGLLSLHDVSISFRSIYSIDEAYLPMKHGYGHGHGHRHS